MARIAITAGAALVALLMGVAVGWTAQQWQPSSPGSGAAAAIESIDS